MRSTGSSGHWPEATALATHQRLPHVPMMNSLLARVRGRHMGLRRSEARGALARIATALAVTSLGALSIGAVAVGALAIRTLVVKRARFRRLEIEELVIGGRPFQTAT